MYKLLILAALVGVTQTALCSPIDSSSRQVSEQLLGLDLEQLMDLEVTSASKFEQKLWRVPSAMYVVRGDDIKRMGATTIPDALRSVPGVNVAQINSGAWAVTARGFNGQFANKLLVLVDGKSIYTPLFSGVNWESLDFVLEDIDRIEVIRGPGATMWGANANNGVINIITKRAVSTQGYLGEISAGNNKRGAATFRFGDQLDADTSYRIFSKVRSYDGSDGLNQFEGEDALRNAKGGFRIDHGSEANGSFSISGNIFNQQVKSLETRFLPEIPPFFDNTQRTNVTNGADIRGGYKLRLDSDSSLSSSLSYAYEDREIFGLAQKLHVLDLDFQHDFRLTEHQHAVWGVNARFSSDNIMEGDRVSFTPDSRDFSFASAFFQDEFQLIPNRLSFTLGSKIEHNDFTGIEYQPSAKLTYTPDEINTIWASISRAVRTPSRADENVRLFYQAQETEQGPVITHLYGNEHLESENLLSYEIGYRTQVADNLLLDLASFYSVYSDNTVLIGGVPQAFGIGIEQPLILDNGPSIDSYGAELSIDWQFCRAAKLLAAYSFLKLDAEAVGAGVFSDPNDTEGRNPSNMTSARLSVDLAADWDLDLMTYYVDSLPSIDIDSYLRFDTRLAYTVNQQIELAVVGQNIFSNGHYEFRDLVEGSVPTEMQRVFWGTLTVKFM